MTPSVISTWLIHVVYARSCFSIHLVPERYEDEQKKLADAAPRDLLFGVFAILFFRRPSFISRCRSRAGLFPTLTADAAFALALRFIADDGTCAFGVTTGVFCSGCSGATDPLRVLFFGGVLALVSARPCAITRFVVVALPPISHATSSVALTLPASDGVHTTYTVASCFGPMLSVDGLSASAPLL